jgi:predicted ATP-grasp superfamily ATP-dependent carboligase
MRRAHRPIHADYRRGRTWHRTEQVGEHVNARRSSYASRMTLSLDLRHFSRARPPVVLLGSLNVARAAGLAGLGVIVASSEQNEAAFASRYCRGRLLLPPLEDRAAVLDALLRTGERLTAELGTRIPLFYGNDDRQRLVQQYRTELGRCYALLLNDPEVADAVIEKDLFEALAARRGLPIPRTLEWDALEGFDAPVLVKPRTKFAWDVSPVHVQLFGRRGKARVFRDGRALAADAGAQQLARELVIQEYVEGDDRQIWSYHGFCDEHGQLLDWFIGRKIRTYPALTGISTFLELAHDDELAELGPRIARAMPLKGVFKVDFKRDARTGRFRILEVNARFNLWHYLGAANGVNLPRVAYDYLVHGARPATSGRYRTTHRWLYLRYDWKAYREAAAQGELGFAAWLGSLAERPRVCQLFAWSDPLPFLSKFYHWVRERVPRVPGLVRRWLSTAS